MFISSGTGPLERYNFHLLLCQFVQVNQTLSLPSLLLQQGHVVFTSVSISGDHQSNSCQGVH